MNITVKELQKRLAELVFENPEANDYYVTYWDISAASGDNSEHEYTVGFQTIEEEKRIEFV